MGMLIVLLLFFVLLALLIDLRQLLETRSVKIWAVYSLLMLIGVTLVILSLTPIHQVNLFFPIERVMRPVSQWVFQL